MAVMLNTGEDMCPHGAVCQANPNINSSPTPNANSDLDSDDRADINSAWAGIAVVIVVFVVALCVWYAIRRRRRARGGHNSVGEGGSGQWFRWLPGRRFGAFWRKSSVAKSPEQPIAVGGEMELVEDEEAKQERRSSSATNLKRTATSGTIGTDESHAARLDTSLKIADEESRLYPMAETQRQSEEAPVSALPKPIPSHDASLVARPPAPSSARSSLSRLSIPPPGLGPPIHAYTQPPPISAPPPSHPPS